MAGPGIRQGALSHFPARLIDVAPPVLRVLGVPAAPMDGIVLADALVSPTAAEVGGQASLSGPLTAYQDALIEQSLSNIAEDEATGVVPRPVPVPQP